MKVACLLVGLLFVPRIAQSQDLISKPIGVIREVKSTARDFATFRDPEWSALTLAQIGASSADAFTSLHNLQNCGNCYESGPSRVFVGRRPDAHKYVLGGAIEIGIEAVTSHYFRNRGPMRKWYWRALWELPQTFSLYEHAHAAYRNSELNLGCSTSAPACR
jgi:hypothetical protein